MDVRDFIRKLLKYCIPSIISAIVGIIVIPLISRIFPAGDYGKINLFYSVGNMMLYIVLLGLDSAYIRFYFEQPEGISRKQLFSLSFWLSILLACMATVMSLLFFPQLVSVYLFGERYMNGITALLVYTIGLVLFRLLSIETRMEDKALRYNVQQILLIFTNRVSFLIVALYSTNYKYSIWIIAISTIILGIYFFLTQKKISDLEFPNTKRGVLKTILLFSIPLMPTTIITWMNNSAAKVVLSSYNDFDSVGVLSIATSVANVFSLVPTAFTTYWSPFMYKNYKKEEEFIKKVHDYICLLCVCLVVLIFCFQDILYALVGENYKMSQPYFMLVMLTPIQTLLCETTCYGIILSNRTKYNLYISIIAVVYNVVTGIFLYKFIGVYGVVIGISGAAVIQIILKTIVGQKYYKTIRNPVKSFIAIVILIGLASLNVIVYDSWIVRLIISAITLVFVAILYKDEVMSFFHNKM